MAVGKHAVCVGLDTVEIEGVGIDALVLCDHGLAE